MGVRRHLYSAAWSLVSLHYFATVDNSVFFKQHIDNHQRNSIGSLKGHGFPSRNVEHRLGDSKFQLSTTSILRAELTL